MPGKITSNDIVWSGVHYLLFLKAENGENDSVRLSLFDTEYSPHGEGYVAFFDNPHGPLPGGFYTDNRELAPWLYQTLYRGKENPFSKVANNIVSSRFERHGDTRDTVTILIKAEAGSITAAWEQLEAPFMARGGGEGPNYWYSLFFTAPAARVLVNESRIPGTVYMRDIWTPFVGRPLSSCLFAREMWVQRDTVREAA
jgi:hypothetical protein